MTIKTFECGLCKKEQRTQFTRKGLRKHLAEEHRILQDKFNTTTQGEIKKKKSKRKWIIKK